MPDVFVEWIDERTIVIYDAEECEIWRGTALAIGALRALREAGMIGLYEEGMPE